MVELVCELAGIYGKELAGLGIGFMEEGSAVVEDIVVGENLSEERDRFYLDPVAIIEGHRLSEMAGLEVVALVHTHRTGATPSPLDAEGMLLWPIPWVIVDEADCSVRAWVVEGKSLRELSVRVLSACASDGSGYPNPGDRTEVTPLLTRFGGTLPS